MPTVMDSGGKVDTCTHTTRTLPHGITKAFSGLINTKDVAESSIKIYIVPISSNYSDLSLSFSTTCPASHSCSTEIIYKSPRTLYVFDIQAHWKASVMTLHSIHCKRLQTFSKISAKAGEEIHVRALKHRVTGKY